jgi:hypothetical protein
MAQLKDYQAGTAGDNVTVGGNLSVTGTSTLTGNVTITGTATMSGRNVDAFPSGTKMLFQQTSAPTGWTKDTTHDNKALRVVSGTAGSGGTRSFTAAFASQNVGSTSLTEANLPAHTHSFSATTSTVGDHVHGLGADVQTQVIGSAGPFYTGNQINIQYGLITQTQGAGAHSHTVSGTTGSVGSGTGHTHSIDMAVQYVDVIICTKS